MDVTLLYLDDCPNWQVADGRLTDALLVLGLDPSIVEHQLISSDEQAKRARFRGSPTILINGVDPFETDDDGPVGLSCRVYRNETGFAGAPTVDELLTALKAHASGRPPLG